MPPKAIISSSTAPRLHHITTDFARFVPGRSDGYYDLNGSKGDQDKKKKGKEEEGEVVDFHIILSQEEYKALVKRMGHNNSGISSSG